MKNKTLVSLILIFTFINISSLTAQQSPEGITDWGDETSWKSTASSGNWNANNWFNITRNWDNHNPNYDGHRRLIFDNNNQLTMTNDFTDAGIVIWEIRFTSNASESRSISGSEVNSFVYYSTNKPKIENYSTANHIINFPIRIDGNPLELNPINGDLTFSSSIDNNGNYIDVYGTNGKNLTITSDITGSGGISIKQNSKVILSTNNKSYIGPTVIEAGTLEISVNLGSSVTIKNGGSLIVTGDCTIPGLTIESGGTATIYAGKALTVTGTLSNSAGNGGIVIKSDGTNGTGSLKHNTASIAGTVERYFTGSAESWHLVSSPVASQEISGSFTPAGTYGDGTGYDFYTWYESTMTWVNKKNTTGAPTWETANGGNNFVVGRGYLAAYQAANPTKSFAGNLNNGSISYTLSKSGTGAYAGFNLVGNPYPSSIDWKAGSGWTRSALVDNGGGYDMWIYNAAVGNYGVYNSSDLDDNGTNSVTRYIPVGQGFMVKAISASNLTMTNDVRTTQNPSFLKSTSEIANILRLKVSDLQNSFSDEIKIEFGHLNDIGGAEKMFSFEDKAPSLFTVKSTGNYSTDYRSELRPGTIPISFRAGVDGDYSFTVSNLGSFPTGTLISIEDLQQNITHDLRVEPQFSFTAKKTDSDSRFLLHFGGTFSVGEYPNNQLSIFSRNESIIVSNNLSCSTSFDIFVYNLTGQLITRNNTQNQSTVIIPLSAPTGFYLVRVVTPEATKTAKVFVK